MSGDALAEQLIIVDGRQSPVAAAVQRGVCRLLRDACLAAVTELCLASGRRADVMALSGHGDIWIVEIKSCFDDFRADRKWPEYWDYCDRLYFAIPPEMPAGIIPEEAGLIVADRFGADVVREVADRRLAPARRKAVTLRFARAAALRLQSLADPFSLTPVGRGSG